MRVDEENFERFFSIAETGRILGLERSATYSRIKSGKLRGVRLDGAVKVPRSEIQRYLSTAKPLAFV
jgi:excisionase family DNA binding protein